MSDLQCAATFLVVDPAGPDVHGLVDRLRDRRVAAVRTTADAGAPDAGAVLAQRLGVGAGSLAGDDLVAALSQVADLFRGETVVVVAGRERLGEALARTAPGARDTWAARAGDDVVEVLADGDGWALGARVPSGDGAP